MLSNSIKNLLKLHGRIIVPDLGAFIFKGGPFPTIYFNEFLRYDDSILVDDIVETDKIDKNAALEKVKAFVDNVIKQLSAGKSVELDGLGTLFKDANDKIQLKTANMKVNNFVPPVQVEKDPEPREVYFEIEKTEVVQPVVDKTPVKEAVPPKVEVAATSDKSQTSNTSPLVEAQAQQTQAKTVTVKTTTEIPQQKQQQTSQPYRTPPPIKPVVHEMPRKKSSKGWIFILFLLIAGAGVYFGYYNPVWKNWFPKIPFVSRDSISAALKSTANNQNDTTSEPEKTQAAPEKKIIAQAKPAPVKQVSETKTSVSKPASEIKKSTTSIGGKKFHLIAGSFSVEANADKMAQKLKKEGFDSEIISKDKFFMVSYGSYGDKAEANREMDKLKAGGKESVWILHN